MNAESKTRVLVFAACYLPGFKAGGPIRTIVNLVQCLGDEFDFWIVTSDRDLGDDRPYEQVQVDRWNKVGKAQVFYASPSRQSFTALAKIVRDTPHDVLYLNSFFGPRFTLRPMLARWLRLIPRKPLVIAPRGEFSSGALALKAPKKHLFILLSRWLRFYAGAIWQASSAAEVEDIRRNFQDGTVIRVAINIAQPDDAAELARREADAPLRLLFVSRISPKKNLLGAVQMLQQVQCPVVFDVYGPAEDAAYWASCQQAAKALPAHVQFNYCGALYPAQVPETMARYDLFYLPTQGENFGHVIAEALGCGLPVLIADTTPWRDLVGQNLGWDIPLSQPGQFVAAIEQCSRLPAADYDAWRQRIRAWALAHIGNEEAIEQNRQLFMNLK